MNGQSAGMKHELTSIRFLAALWVLAFHFAYTTPALGWYRPYAPHGRAGVSLFFVLSGFILTYNYAKHFQLGVTAAAYRSFMRARFARIYPMYLLALVLFTPVAIMIGQSDHSKAELVGSWFIQASGVQAWIPIRWVIDTWNVPMWSVSVEFFFYAMFPLLIAKLARINRTSTLILIMLATYIAEAATHQAMVVILRNRGVLSAYDMVPYRFPLLRFPEFIIGCCCGCLFLRHSIASQLARNLWLLAGIAGVAAVIVGLQLGVPGTAMGHWYVLYTPIWAVLLLPLASGPTFITPLLTWRPMVLLGEASYSLYLLHWIPLSIVQWKFNSEAPWYVTALAVVACIIASLAASKFVEQPARAFLRGKPRERIAETPARETVAVTC